MKPVAGQGADKVADTRVQTMVENWVQREWMPERYGQRFSREPVLLSSGGHFNFDAVSADGNIIAVIFNERLETASGKHAVGKMLKVRSDLFFLLLTGAERRIALLTERDMYERWLREVENGRVPNCIEFVHVEIPNELNSKLEKSRRKASREVTPG